MMHKEIFSQSSVILSCSPRPQGNCDSAADIFIEKQRSLTPAKKHVMLKLRDFKVAGCTGCGACSLWAQKVDANEGCLFDAKLFLGCPLSAKDDSRELLTALMSANELCIIAPIYFYHLPSQLKALLDRTQPFWALQESGLQLFPNERACKIILIGAREKGKELFKGSILTLKYSLAHLRIQLHNPLLLNGLDGPEDLLADKPECTLIEEYACETCHA